VPDCACIHSVSGNGRKNKLHISTASTASIFKHLIFAFFTFFVDFFKREYVKDVTFFHYIQQSLTQHSSQSWK
jgi:hypothetical protein